MASEKVLGLNMHFSRVLKSFGISFHAAMQAVNKV
jgi:hypothetical protein